MGMGTIACHGFVLEATEENLGKLGYGFKSLKELAIKNAKENGSNFTAPDENDLKDIHTLLEYLGCELVEVNLKFYGKVVGVQFINYDRENCGDIYDDLTTGTYITIEEEELYERKLTSEGERMKELGALPTEKRWTHFG